jgi:hypothetical protein
MRRARASTKGNPATMRRLWAAGIVWARISFLAPESAGLSGDERPVSQCWYQNGYKKKANRAFDTTKTCKALTINALNILVIGRLNPKWPVYRPYFVNNLAK